LLTRSLRGDGNHHFAYCGFVSRIRRCDVHRDRGATLVNQQMDFRALACAVGWVLASGLASQWRSAAPTVNRLPGPLNATCPIVETQQHLQDFSEATFLLPGLEALMNDRTAHTKPGSMDGFPLTASPQDI